MPDHTTDIPLKRCTTCGEWKPATAENFTKDKRRKDGLSIYCRVCRSAYEMTYRVTHRDEIKARDIAFHAANRERMNIRSANYYAANREKMKSRIAAYHATHPEIGLIKVHRRRARERSLPSTFTAPDWMRCLEYWQYRCAVCGRPQGLWHKLAQDHWVPVSKGGAFTPDNIVPLCHGDGGCNNSKCNRNAHEWLTRKFGKRKTAAIERRIQDYFDWVKDEALGGAS